MRPATITNVVLNDTAGGESPTTIPVGIDIDPDIGVQLSIPTHILPVVSLEVVNGKPRVIVWADGDTDEPTHIIEFVNGNIDQLTAIG